MSWTAEMICITFFFFLQVKWCAENSWTISWIITQASFYYYYYYYQFYHIISWSSDGHTWVRIKAYYQTFLHLILLSVICSTIMVKYLPSLWYLSLPFKLLFLSIRGHWYLYNHTLQPTSYIHLASTVNANSQLWLLVNKNKVYFPYQDTPG